MPTTTPTAVEAAAARWLGDTRGAEVVALGDLPEHRHVVCTDNRPLFLVDGAIEPPRPSGFYLPPNGGEPTTDPQSVAPFDWITGPVTAARRRHGPSGLFDSAVAVVSASVIRILYPADVNGGVYCANYGTYGYDNTHLSLSACGDHDPEEFRVAWGWVDEPIGATFDWLTADTPRRLLDSVTAWIRRDLREYCENDEDEIAVVTSEFTDQFIATDCTKRDLLNCVSWVVDNHGLSEDCFYDFPQLTA